MDKLKNKISRYESYILYSSPVVTSSILSFACNLFIVVKLLGLDGYGRLSLYLLLGGLFSELSSLPIAPLKGLLNSKIINSNNSKAIAFYSELVLKIILFLAVLTSLSIYTTTSPNSVNYIDIRIIILSLLATFHNTGRGFILYQLSCESKTKYFAVLELSTLCMPIIGGIIGLIISPDLLHFFIARSIVSLILFIYIGLSIQCDYKLIINNIKQLSKSLFSILLLGYESTILEQGLDLATRITIQGALSPTTLGVYSFLLAASMPLQMITFSFSKILRNTIIKKINQNEKIEINIVLKRMLPKILLLSLLPLTFMIIYTIYNNFWSISTLIAISIALITRSITSLGGPLTDIISLLNYRSVLRNSLRVSTGVYIAWLLIFANNLITFTFGLLIRAIIVFCYRYILCRKIIINNEYI